MQRAAAVRIWCSATIALTGTVIASAPRAWASVGDMQLASRAPGAAGAKALGDSTQPKLSADGRSVAFVTTATNLDPADGDADVPDVYVRDLVTGGTTLVSRADGPNAEKGNGVSSAPAISADGRYVAFVSEATNLAPDQADVAGVFLRDLERNTTRLVSRASTGAAADGDSASPAISADGRVVAFASDATNLAPDDTDSLTDIFARDVLRGATVLVSGPGADPRSGTSTEPSISADGSVVAFSSTVTALVPEDDDPPESPLSDVFTRDLRTGALALVSRRDGADGQKGNDASDSPSISGDGKVVAFRSTATNLNPADVDGISDVFVRNFAMGTTAIASLGDRSIGGKGAADSGEPVISHTGRFVAFSSLSALVEADADELADVYSRDVAADRTRLVSRAAGVLGAKSDGASGSPSISANARFVAFASAGANLHPDDPDASTDIFVRDVLGTVLPLGPLPPRTPGAVTPPGRFAVVPLSCPVDGVVAVLTGAGDRRDGGPGSDILLGRGGRDVLRGMGGRDCLYGGRGADRLFGGAGGDVLNGGRDADLLSGGRGADRLADARGSDRFSGGAGNDAIDAHDASRSGRRRGDRVSCGPGRDRARVDRRDVVARDCERVIRSKAVRSATSPPGFM